MYELEKKKYPDKTQNIFSSGQENSVLEKINYALCLSQPVASKHNIISPVFGTSCHIDTHSKFEFTCE